MDLLNNPWFIGISGGVLSGLLVTWLSRVIFSRRDNREYAQKVAAANREVIYAIRPGIPEGTIPSLEIVRAMISSTARKYGTDVKDMLGSKEVAEDLVKEVMDSSFISAKSKAEFCAQLAHLMITVVSPNTGEIHQPAPSVVLAEYRQRTITLLSTMMGLFAALMTFALALSDRFSSPFGILSPTFIAMFGVALAAYMWFFLRYLERRRQVKSKQIEERGREFSSEATTEKA